MAKTVKQAEAELRVAALEYAEAYRLYGNAFDRNGDRKRYVGLAPGAVPAPLHPETEALVKVSCEKQHALCAAAETLRVAVRGQQQAEAK